VLSRVARGKVVVVGDRETLPLFKSAGFTTVEAYSQTQALNIVSRLQGSGDAVLIIVLKNIIDNEEEFKAKTAESRIPVFVLPTLWSPGEPLDVNKLLAKALGL
jgi:V/A-type H+-transporting ATPase subunit F